MVNIDDVYQKVLATANKEQRGYITPQEFNLFADHAQMEFFEQYFYDLNQFTRVLGNSTDHSDVINIVNEKIAFFETTGSGLTLPTDLYRLGNVTYFGAKMTVIEQVQQGELVNILHSSLLAPNDNRRIYVRINASEIQVYPTTSTSAQQVRYDYIRIPAKPSWGYFIVGNKALYDSSITKTTHFELHPSEESELVYKILKLAGISMQKIDVAQAAQGLETIQTTQKKQ